MTRVVMFSPGHGEVGGAASRSRLVAAELAASDWKVLALTRAGTYGWFRLVREPGLTVLELPGFNRPRVGGVMYLAMAIPLGLIAGLRARGFIAIQLMSTATAAGICGTVLRKPFIAMSTTSGDLGEARYITGTRTSGLRVRLLRRAASIVAQTGAVADQLRDLTGSDRVVVVPNPVRISATMPLNGEPRALFMGRFSAEKDLPGLLTAWENVLKEVADARLTLAGTGGEYRSIEPQLRAAVAASPTLARSVDLPGWVDEPRTLLDTHDVFVLPSLEEGMSNALLEAVAAGRLVVASAIEPNRAVLGDDYPLLFEPGDRVALAVQLLQAMRMDRAERDGLRARLNERVREFAPAAVVGRLKELIDAADRARH